MSTPGWCGPSRRWGIRRFEKEFFCRYTKRRSYGKGKKQAKGICRGGLMCMTVAGRAEFIGEIEVSGFHELLLKEALGGYQRFHFIVLQTVKDPFFKYRAVCIEMDIEGRGNSSKDSINDLCHGLLVALHAAYMDCGENVEKFRSRITDRVPKGAETGDGIVAAYFQVRVYQMSFEKRMEFISIENEKVEAVFKPLKSLNLEHESFFWEDGVAINLCVVRTGEERMDVA
jgi:hypothetical protein